MVLGGISADCHPSEREDGSKGWWHGLFGKGAPLGADRYRILGLDFIADDNGDYSPSTHEQASILADCLAAIGEEPAAIIGASYGGMVALAFAERFGSTIPLVIISAGAAPHSMATAARGLQRQVVRLGLEQGCAREALSIARGMAMLTYRSPKEFKERFEGGLRSTDPCGPSEPMSYLQSRGTAFVDAMAPGRYLSLSGSIDRHRVDPASIKAPALIIGVEEDALVPVEDSKALAAALGGPVDFHAIHSLYGHDAFLKEPEALGALIEGFLDAPRS